MFIVLDHPVYGNVWAVEDNRYTSHQLQMPVRAVFHSGSALIVNRVDQSPVRSRGAFNNWKLSQTVYHRSLISLSAVQPHAMAFGVLFFALTLSVGLPVSIHHGTRGLGRRS